MREKEGERVLVRKGVVGSMGFGAMVGSVVDCFTFTRGG